MIISTTFQNKARVSDGLLLGLPQLIKVQIRGNVEFVQHADHLLTTITLPGMNKTQRTEGVMTPIKHTSENGIIKKTKQNKYESHLDKASSLSTCRAMRVMLIDITLNGKF